MNANNHTTPVVEMEPPHRWARIRSKLEQAKARLVTVGAVMRQGNSHSPDRWVCKYRERVDGRWVQRSIYLGPAELAGRARALIQQWREESLSPEDRLRQEWLRLWDQTATARGFSKRARKRLRAAVLRARGNRPAELQLAYEIMDDQSALRVGKRRGRPRRAGLW